MEIREQGRVNREQEKRKQNPGPGNETWDRGSDLENVKASSEGKSWSDGAERKRTCAVLRVRGKGKRSGREAEAGAKRERSECGGGTEEKRESVEGSRASKDLDNPIFPVTIA